MTVDERIQHKEKLLAFTGCGCDGAAARAGTGVSGGDGVAKDVASNGVFGEAACGGLLEGREGGDQGEGHG